MNNMVNALNAKILKAANAFTDFGVFYTEDYQSGFDGHRFCEKAREPAENPTGSDIWFYHADSPLNDQDTGPAATTQAQWDKFYALAFRPKGSRAQIGQKLERARTPRSRPTTTL